MLKEKKKNLFENYKITKNPALINKFKKELGEKNTSKYYENIENSEKDSEPLLGTTFHPKSIFTKQNNNISFYQSSSLNNLKNFYLKE